MKYILIVVVFCNDIHKNLHGCYIFNIDKSISIEYCKSKTRVTLRTTVVKPLCRHHFSPKLRY